MTIYYLLLDILAVYAASAVFLALIYFVLSLKR
jgi:hypothetical protein